MGPVLVATIAMVRTLRRMPAAIEAIPTDTTEVARRGRMPGDVLRSALREGRVVHEPRG